jgi:hypothetical protein
VGLGLGASLRANWVRWDLWSRSRLHMPGVVPVTTAVVLIAAGSVVLALPSAGEAHPVALPTPRPTVVTIKPTPKPTPTVKPVKVDPLNGLPVPANVPDHPVLAVKVDNAYDARPQTGLDSADVLIEEQVEGGLTRFAALFHSGFPPVVGPVRSIRSTDVGLLSPLHARVAYSGGIGPFVADLRAHPITDVGADLLPNAYSRSSSRLAPHNLYVDTSQVVAFGPNPEPMFTFDTRAKLAKAGAFTLGAKVQFPATTVEFRVMTDGRFFRMQDGVRAVAADGAALTFDNVVILHMPTRLTGFIDPAGNPVPEMVTTGSGTATVLSAGRIRTGQWSKASVTSGFKLTDDSGQPLAVTPGHTAIELDAS